VPGKEQVIGQQQAVIARLFRRLCNADELIGLGERDCLPELHGRSFRRE
jgi:hypothetical protein